MKFLVRQTYTTASLGAMLPAAVWACASYNAQNIASIVGGFPFYYLFVSQLLVVPRYTLSAAAVERMAQYGRKQRLSFNTSAAVKGFVAAGLLVDAWLLWQFAHDIAQPVHDVWPGVVPLLTLPVGLLIMVAAAAAAGYQRIYKQRKLKKK